MGGEGASPPRRLSPRPVPRPPQRGSAPPPRTQSTQSYMAPPPHETAPGWHTNARIQRITGILIGVAVTALIAVLLTAKAHRVGRDALPPPQLPEVASGLPGCGSATGDGLQAPPDLGEPSRSPQPSATRPRRAKGHSTSPLRSLPQTSSPAPPPGRIPAQRPAPTARTAPQAKTSAGSRTVRTYNVDGRIRETPPGWPLQRRGQRRAIPGRPDGRPSVAPAQTLPAPSGVEGSPTRACSEICRSPAPTGSAVAGGGSAQGQRQARRECRTP